MDWSLFISVFGLIFVAELPDKTAFASILLATRHHPFAVFLGACGAFLIQSAVAVTVGTLLGHIPSGEWVHRGAGVLFLLFAVLMAIRKDDDDEIKDDDAPPLFWRDAATAFVTIFLAEWGDLTQLATATLAAQTHAPLTIFASSTLSLWCVTALGVIVGHFSKKALHPLFLKWTAAAAFAGVGIWMLLH
jgi:putative Ca2+/H+ antiporter (TMEM165/GDT1 family)